mmetsp:Transcript_13554/g.57378  ORF Transcript_13554/g.57378 Transcript_13554/m.57378 type:complete len:465 (-) Transcript_13554:1610-3004(-)
MNCACANPRAWSCVARSSERSERETPGRVVSNCRPGVATTAPRPATPRLAAFLRRFFLFPDALTACPGGVCFFGSIGCGVFRSVSLDRFSRFSPSESRTSSRGSPSSSSSGSDPPASPSRTPSIRRYSARGPPPSSSSSSPTAPPAAAGLNAANRTRSVERFLLHLTRLISRWSHPSGRGTSAERDAPPPPSAFARTHRDGGAPASAAVTISATMLSALVTPGSDTCASKYPPDGRSSAVAFPRGGAPGSSSSALAQRVFTTTGRSSPAVIPGHAPCDSHPRGVRRQLARALDEGSVSAPAAKPSPSQKVNNRRQLRHTTTRALYAPTHPHHVLDVDARIDRRGHPFRQPAGPASTAVRQDRHRRAAVLPHHEARVLGPRHPHQRRLHLRAKRHRDVARRQRHVAHDGIRRRVQDARAQLHRQGPRGRGETRRRRPNRARRPSEKRLPENAPAWRKSRRRTRPG